MEIECRRCQRKTPHEVRTAEEGVALAECLRCRDLDAEAAKLREAKEREEEIARRAGVTLTSREGPGVPMHAIVVMLGGAILAVATFLPWVTITNPFGGDLSFNGTENGNSDGWLTLGFGAAALVTALSRSERKVARGLWIILGLLGGAVAGYDIWQVMERIKTMDPEYQHLAHVGYGLYAAAVGSVAIIVGATLSGPRKA